MKTCPNCQNPVNDNELFCPNCGTRVDAQQNTGANTGYTADQQQPYAQQDYAQQNYNQQNYGQQNYNQQYYGQPTGGYYPPQQPIDQGLNTTPYLVWSILNLLFCCMPLGIWSLILTCTLNKKPTREEAEKSLKTAKILCIVGTAVGFVVEALYVLMMIGIMAAGY